MDYTADLIARIEMAIAHGATLTQMSEELGLGRAYLSRLRHRHQAPQALQTASRIATWCDTHVARSRTGS